MGVLLRWRRHQKQKLLCLIYAVWNPRAAKKWLWPDGSRGNSALLQTFTFMIQPAFSSQSMGPCKSAKLFFPDRPLLLEAAFEIRNFSTLTIFYSPFGEKTPKSLASGMNCRLFFNLVIQYIFSPFQSRHSQLNNKNTHHSKMFSLSKNVSEVQGIFAKLDEYLPESIYVTIKVFWWNNTWIFLTFFTTGLIPSVIFK